MAEQFGLMTEFECTCKIIEGRTLVQRVGADRRLWLEGGPGSAEISLGPGYYAMLRAKYQGEVPIVERLAYSKEDPKHKAPVDARLEHALDVFNGARQYRSPL